MTTPRDLKLTDRIRLAENQEPRCPCVLLLDTSNSMNRNDRISQLNQGIQDLKAELSADPMTNLRAEVCLMTFADRSRVVHDFASPADLEPPRLHAGGNTNALQAITDALHCLEKRKQVYRDRRLAYYRGIIVFITDGEIIPHGAETSPAVRRVRQSLEQQEDQRGVAFFAVGTAAARLEQLNLVSPRPARLLDQTRFPEFFQWLSNSIQAVSNSQVNDRVIMPPSQQWEI